MLRGRHTPVLMRVVGRARVGEVPLVLFLGFCLDSFIVCGGCCWWRIVITIGMVGCISLATI